MRRIYHHWEKWECFRAGFYYSAPPPPMNHEDALEAYATFLRDTTRFRFALSRVVSEWPMSCEHFLSKPNINRIAWLGQASMCIATGVPSCFRGGFHRLSAEDQALANYTAEECLIGWLRDRCDERGDLKLIPIEEHNETDSLPSVSGTRRRVSAYESAWISRGYADGIPDEVPLALMRDGLAPSYKAICHALLKNDVGLYALGFKRTVSTWYGALKRMELAERPGTEESMQMSLFSGAKGVIQRG